MDDRFYLAVYDEGRMNVNPEDYVCDVVLPGYELCQAGAFPAIRRSRFAQTAGRLYQLEEQMLPIFDQLLAPELIRHQAMAADEERLYNVYVYVAKDT